MAQTLIPGVQCGHVEIRKQCRANHGDMGAFEVAVEYARKKYAECVGAPANKEATFNLVLTVDRENS